MSISLIVWLVVLIGINIGQYMWWLSIKDKTGTGYLADFFACAIIGIIIVIADVSTLASLVF